VSHNALSDTQSNGKTMSAFFKHWDINNLAQLFLTTDVPDFSICRKYFQINDFDMLKRALFNKSVQGRSITKADVAELDQYKKAVTTSLLVTVIKKSLSPAFRLARDMMWKFGDCKTRELSAFIDDFNPQAVFFQSSSGVFAFSLVRWICETRNIPLIMQTTDDYVTQKRSLDPFSWIQCANLLSAYKWAVSYSDCVIAIGDKMAKEYQSRFGGNYYVAMNSVANLNLPKPISKDDTVRFLYAGNLILNRWKVLALISECLADLFREQGLKGELDIYSLVEPGPDELSHLNKPPFSSYKGALNTRQLNEVKTAADVLVHVEAFDKANRHVTRLSISTKIPEYLISGRCIFAVGPGDVASMQYIAEHDLGVAVMSSNKDEIKEALAEVMINSEKRARYAEQGVSVARLRHDADKAAEDIYQIISSSIEKCSK